MDIETIEGWWRGLRTAVTDNPEMWAAIGAATVALLAGATLLWWLRRRRHARGQQEATANRERTATLVRRPLYIDAIGLADLLAVSESSDLSRSMRDELEPSGLGATDVRTRESRDLNKVLAALEAHPHLAADLDRDPDAALTPGRAIRVTGRLTRLAASDLAELLELATPLLIHAGEATRERTAASPQRIDLSRPVATDAPLVAELTADGTDQRFLVVFQPDGWREGVEARLPRSATLVGVIDQRLDSGTSLAAADYLTPHLSTDARRAVADRDLHDVAGPLADLSETRLRKRDLTFKGPGAVLTPVALYH